MQRIIIRHEAGSKANQVENFPLEGLRELSLGRDPSCLVRFDPEKDDLVSRHHASIRIHNDGELSFKIADEKSRNGTIVGGQRVTGETELLPGDVVELGPGGPKFIFDVEPRPPHLAARTRTMSLEGGASTRAFNAAATSETGETTEPKSAVGRETVERLIYQGRKAANRTAAYGLAAVLVVLAIIGAMLYHQSTVAEQRVLKTAEQRIIQKTGVKNPREIAGEYRDSTVMISTQWRLYDKQSGHQIFHKYITIGKDKVGHIIKKPAYVKLEDQRIVRWLVTDDERETNVAIRGEAQGSGFVVRNDGFILTNKHIVAGWLVAYSNFEEAPIDGLVYQQEKLGGSWSQRTLIDKGKPFTPDDSLRGWIPTKEPNVLFRHDKPVILRDGFRLLEGRSEVLDVRFPGNALSVEGRFIRAATIADAALIKVDVPDPVKQAPLADSGYRPALGEPVTVMGYPRVSPKTYAVIQSVDQGGQLRELPEVVPEATITEGVVSYIGSGISRHEKDPNLLTIGTEGEVYQLSINTTGEGNSGGPVFNSSGQVIGLLTYMRSGTVGEIVSFAVPIKYGRDILQLDRVIH